MRAGDDVAVSKAHLRWRSPTPVQGLLIAILAAVLALAVSTAPQAIGAPAIGSASSAAAAATEVVAIRAKINNRYVAAEDGGNASLIANRTAIGPWETFDLIRVNSTDVSLRAHANGKYVTAESAGAGPLISNRDVAGPWETFALIRNNDGSSSLRARANGAFVTAENAGNASLIANRGSVGTWEKFDLVAQTTAPAAPGWPGPANTGVSAGTVLSRYSGPCTITSTVKLSKVDATSCAAIVIRGAKGVEIAHSLVPRVEATDGVGSVRISDSTVRAGDWVGGSLWGYNITALRVNVTGGQHSFHCNDNCSVTDSWLHDQYNAPGGAFHNNAFISNGGRNMVIRHNTLHCTAILNATNGGCTADLSLFGDFGPIDNVLVEGNLMKANNSSVSYCAYGGYEPAKRFPVATNVRFVNNVFERGENGKCGVYGPATSFQPSATGNIWSGNRFTDGQAVNPL